MTMKKTLLLAILFLEAGIMHSAVPFQESPAGKPESPDTFPKTALILIDIQEFYFDTAKSPLEGRFEASLQAGKILGYFRETGQEIVHIMHKGGGDIHPNVAPLPGETVFVKQHVNCFRETPLLEYLRDKGIRRLVIAGMMTHMCVEAATRSADDLGFETVLIHDACATRDLRFGDEMVRAGDVHLSTLSTLRAYARVIPAEEFLGE